MEGPISFYPCGIVPAPVRFADSVLCLPCPKKASRALLARSRKGGGWEALRRWVDEGLITGFPPARRIHYINIVQYSVPILYRRRGDAEVDAVIRAGRSYNKTCWSCFWSLIRAHPPNENPSSSRPPVTAPAVRSRMHVSAFALVVFWHDPNGTPIVAARFLGSTAWRCKGRFLGAYISLLKRLNSKSF